MKTFRFRSFTDCFAPKSHVTLGGLAHPRWVAALVTVFLFLAGFKFRAALVLALTLVLLLTFNYFYLRAIAEKIFLKTFPMKAVNEREPARLSLEFSNLSVFGLNHSLLKFEFSGSAFPSYARVLEDEVPAGGRLLTSTELNCDNGMGLFEIKDFRLLLSDFFGILQVEIHFDQSVSLEVRPHIEELPHVTTRGSRFSELYGSHEIQNRGLSVNFSNLRPYAFGDSVRHVAWRPSARHGQIIVKEFERMVNTDATVILNLNPEQHVGLAGLNTWETAKDICLSLVSQLIEEGNSVEFIYNYGVIEKASGQDQFYAVAKALIEHDMSLAARGDHKKRIHVDDPFGNASSRLRPGSTLIYITTVSHPHLSQSAQTLKWLRREHVEVILVLINPLTIWPEFRALDLSLEMPSKTDKINPLLTDMQVHGVRVFIADMGGLLADHFREKPKLSEKLTAPRFSRAKGAR